MYLSYVYTPPHKCKLNKAQAAIMLNKWRLKETCFTDRITEEILRRLLRLQYAFWLLKDDQCKYVT